ncbi:MAG: hypothetical protein QOI14_579 [Actinomycetota bacterium]|nr:hypothetical protein [Actinomycetota bacterium]
MDKADTAELISGLALAVMVLVLAIVGRKDLVAEAAGSYTVPNTSPDAPAGATISVAVKPGTVIPRGHSEAAANANIASREVKRSALGAILSGVDNRVSTSKTVVFAWTIAVAFGLLSLIVAIWLGDHAPWDVEVNRGLQDDYLLLLGGPYAAAILAKYATSSQQDTKTSGPVGGAATAQLVTDDNGNTDLGDFQYVLFNAIGLMFFLGNFIGDLGEGFPDLPPILTGLMLTSTGGYAAKKFLQQAVPTLISVIPASAAAGASVQIFGANLEVPASAAAGGQDLHPTVLVGSKSATVTAHDLVLGNDRLTITIPADAVAGSASISVARADGVQAKDARGVAVLAFEVVT